MKFRRLKLSGFKSFVEPAELRIEPGLTGVVGPNGCGKSNLLEAIRWVMGEGSPKSLRGGGMEDVIFAGTEARPARDFAEVSLLIERSREEAGEDAGETEVTRRIERGAGSAYRINGRDVRAKDVALLFADAATGAHSPALVSQGKIGQVIAAKPTERRKMLEEAAGIAGLHQRRKDAEQKLRAAESNLERLDHLLGEQAARAAALKRQARAAERYRLLTEKIRLAEARLIAAQWQDADKSARRAASEAEEAAKKTSELETRRKQAQERQAEAAKALASAREDAVYARSAGQDLAHRLATARAERDTVLRRLDELDRAFAAVAAETAREEALKQDAAKAIAALEEERERIEKQLGDSEGEAERSAELLGKAEKEARDAEAALADLLAREAALRAERRVAEASLESAEAQAARVRAELERVEAQASDLGDGSAEHEALKEAEKEAEVAAKAARDAEAAIATAERARVKAVEQRDAAEAALGEARAALSAAQSEARAIDEALAQSGQGAIAGLKAAPGYEKALAAALGDDIEAELGGDAPRRWVDPGDGQDPPLPDGLVPLAARVEAPPQLRRRLAMVAVADRDEGQELKAGQRLVTREGKLRRWDGFVAEGSGAAAAERLVRVNRRDALAKTMPALEKAVADAEARRKAASAAVAKAKADGENAREAMADAERRGREAGRAGDVARTAIERMASRRETISQRRDELKPLLQAAEEARREARQALEKLPSGETLKDDIRTARDHAAKAGQRVAEQRAAAATRQREMQAARERHAAAGKEQGDWRTRARDAEKRLEETAERAERQASEREELKDQPAALAEKIAALEAESGAGNAAISKASALEAQMAERLRAAEVVLHDAAEAFASARERRAAALARAEAAEARRADFARASGEAFGCPPQMLCERFGFEMEALGGAGEEKAEHDRLVGDRERIGPVNLVAEQELKELEESQTANVSEKEELEEAIARLRGSIGHLNREGRTRLLAAFEEVNEHFKSLFSTLFGGGRAHLELIDSDDPLEAGLEIMAQPPGKKLAALTLLSGGEQALTAVALIFALFLTNPAPICVLDEVDAPLDDANVERFCDLLERMNRETDTRYLIVTHNAVTMSRMDRLYGVTMIERGVSRLVSVDLGDAEEMLAAE
ncbi:chromosome segregation SMC family protein [Sphingomicrobium lutaoense]|uniref:Chromosome partition protein Smc n=1 Tax=Sphingomicrobium lutaoense TaxID=515949 RepID=A0A839Z3T0_9SPHN|nr:AAA family ATPase [Sphingomicrobium lutaoense]MBB3764473.1 chromosome segregation protein [Sphingomicrobium lutaoense]